MAGNFSLKNKRIYLDYAATTPVDPRVEKAMRPYFSVKFGNPNSLHYFGQEAMAAVDESREKIAGAIGADFREVIFTGSATEANNLALRGIVKEIRTIRISSESANQSEKNKFGYFSGHSDKFVDSDRPPRIIISAIEHESVLETARDLEKQGVEIIYLPVDKRGFADLRKLKKALNERTVLVSVMYANNEIGAIQPIEKIAEIIKKFRRQNLEFNEKENSKSYILNPISYPFFHTDAVQAFQYLDCDVNKLGIDLMTLSGHKIYGPKGIGALYVKNLEFRIQNLGKENRQNKNALYSKSYILNPIITGGGQEFGRRSGTENVPLIAGFAKAVELVSNSRELETKRIGKLRDYFWKKLKRIYPQAQINGGEPRLLNFFNVYFPGRDAQDLLMKLDLAGIAVSSGSACSARSTQLSHVLTAIGCGKKRIKQSLRFTFGKFTKKTELDEVLKRIENII